MQPTRPKIALARRLRKTMTEPETLLWHCLKDRDDGIVFKRQKAYGPYILDFYCFAARLVVEVDGAIHERLEVEARDDAKDAYLTRQGLHVYRVLASDVYRDVSDVADGIWLLAEDLVQPKKARNPSTTRLKKARGPLPRRPAPEQVGEVQHSVTSERPAFGKSDCPPEPMRR